MRCIVTFLSTPWSGPTYGLWNVDPFWPGKCVLLFRDNWIYIQLYGALGLGVKRNLSRMIYYLLISYYGMERIMDILTCLEIVNARYILLL